MNQLAHVLQEWIDKRLASLVERPEIWGDRESVELQALQLLEVRALVLGAARDDETLQRVQDSYIAFLSERFPDSPPVTLAQRLSEHADAGEFSSHLQEFIGRLIEEQGRTPKAYARVSERIAALAREHRRTAESQEREAVIRAATAGDARPSRQQRGLAFEERVARALELQGFTVESEQLLGGNRVDLVARKQGSLFTPEQCFWVECKDHAKPKGKDVLEKLLGWIQGQTGRQMNARAMVVAQRFTPAALAFAKDHPNELRALTIAELEAALFDVAPYLAYIRTGFENSKLFSTYVRQRVRLESLARHPGVTEPGVDLLEHAHAWTRGQGPRLWLVLGDYGTGKSSFFRRFAYELAKNAEQDRDAPLPLAVDLKEYPNAISIENLLQEHLRETVGWTGNPQVILHLLAVGRFVLLCDAFDEMGVAAAGRSVAEQFRQLVYVVEKTPEQPRGNRVLLTCRSHFFRDHDDVRLTAEGRVYGVSPQADSVLAALARRFHAAIDELMVFSSEQIRELAEHHLGARKAAEVMDFLRDTYDLESLAQRPVLLEMILESFDTLRHEHQRGPEAIRAADLYQVYTGKWLEEHSGHALSSTVADRDRWLRLLAAHLWRSDSQTLHHRELYDLVHALPGETLAHMDPARVDLELRTAAFLTRTADGYYRFSHKSFLEFFLARHWLDAAESDLLADALDTRPSTPALLAFLWDIPDPDGRARLARALRALLTGGYRARASENAVRAVVHGARAYPDLGLSLRDATLAGARLAGEDLAGVDATQADLSGADLDGARMEQAVLTGARLDHASLKHGNLRAAHAARARFVGARMAFVDASSAVLTDADLKDADLTAARLVRADLERAMLRNAVLYGARLADARLHDADMMGADIRRATAPRAQGEPAESLARVPDTLRWRLSPGAIDDVFAGMERVTSAIVFSPDGLRLATGTTHGQVRVTDMRTYEVLCHLDGHRGAVEALAFSSDGLRLASGSSDGTVRIWDLETRAEIQCLQAGSEVKAAAFSPDDRQLLGAGDSKAWLWDVDTGTVQAERPFMIENAHDVAFTERGVPLVATTTEDLDGARIYDVASDEPLRHWPALGSGTRLAVLSRDGRLLAETDRGGDTRIWNVATGNEHMVLPSLAAPVDFLIFSPDSAYLAATTSIHERVVWDIRTDLPVLVKEEEVPDSPAFSPMDHDIIAGYDDTHAYLSDLRGESVTVLHAPRPAIAQARFSSQEPAITAIATDGTVRTWRGAPDWSRGTNQITTTFIGEILILSWSDMALSRDGTLMAVPADMLGTIPETARHVTIRETATGTVVAHLRTNALRVALSPDNALAATVGRSGRRVTVWHIAEQRQLAHIEYPDAAYFLCLAFSHDARFLAASAHVWDWRQGQPVAPLPHGPSGHVHALAFSPDDAVLAVASFGQVTLIEPTTGEVRQTVDFGNQTNPTLAFSPDGCQLAIAFDGGDAHLYSLAERRVVASFRHEGQRIRSVSFSADSQRLLTAGDDGTARIWHVASHTCEMTIAVTSHGWVAIDSQGRWQGQGDGPEALVYYDPNERSTQPTLWLAEDLPEQHA